MSDWKAVNTSDGKTYYYRVGTNETRWEKPEGFVEPNAAPTQASPVAEEWREATNPTDGRKYYYNTQTKQTQWNPPPGFRQQSSQQSQNNPPVASTFVAGSGGRDYGDGSYANSERRRERRDDRAHGLPQKPAFEMGFRGAMPTRQDEPEYGSRELAEEAFSKILRKHNIPPDATWEEVFRKVFRERDFRAIKDPFDRIQAFEKYCEQVRAEEKVKEKERREKLMEDFREMLATHDEIKHYTRWKTARPIIEREAVFRSAGHEDDRRRMFDEYTMDLRTAHAEEQAMRRKAAMRELDGMLKAIVVDPDTKWTDAKSSIMNSERFISEDKFKALHLIDVLSAFDNHMKDLDRVPMPLPSKPDSPTWARASRTRGAVRRRGRQGPRRRHRPIVARSMTVIGNVRSMASVWGR